MANLLISALAILSFLLSSTSQDIEKAFLQNNPKMLYKLFASESYVNVSLPEPIYYSDQLSNQQAYFLFKKIFSAYSTFEFYSDRQSLSSQNQSYILKARWSFRNKRNNNQYVFNIFFYLKNRQGKEKDIIENAWKITEIKAEKI